MFRSFTIIAMIACAGLAFAVPASAEPLEAAIAKTFAADGAGLRLLRDAGFEPTRVLTMERVPSGAYVVEVGMKSSLGTLRYPLKLDRTAEGWTLKWQPTAEYAAALVGIAKSGMLPHARPERTWAEHARMPSFPVIGTRKRIITPFGAFASDEKAEGKSQGDLDVSPSLVQHAHSWVRTVLEEDPGPAGFDLILDRGATWKLANKVIFNVSMVGLYEITIVTSEEGAFGAVDAASPVSVTAASGPPKKVLALYPLVDRFGVRLNVDGKLIERPKPCAEAMTLCVEDAGALPDALEKLIEPGGESAMFAASGDTTVGDGVAFLAAFLDYTGLGDHRILVGYVQR